MTGNLSLTLLYEISTQLNEQLKQGAPDDGTLADYRDAYAKTVQYANETLARLKAEG